jgi:hypothetical protein
VAQKAQRE